VRESVGWVKSSDWQRLRADGMLPHPEGNSCSESHGAKGRVRPMIADRHRWTTEIRPSSFTPIPGGLGLRFNSAGSRRRQKRWCAWAHGRNARKEPLSAGKAGEDPGGSQLGRRQTGEPE